MSAAPGDVIDISDGEYLFDQRLVAEASGTESAPITLRGTRAAMIRTKNASGDYGLHVTGDYWHIEGITVAHAIEGHRARRLGRHGDRRGRGLRHR